MRRRSPDPEQTPPSIRSTLPILPVALVAAVVPLIVYLAQVPLTGAAFDYWTGADTNSDFFSFYKARALVVLTALAVAVTAAALLMRTVQRPRRVPTTAAVGLLAYGCCVVASAALSPFPSIARQGFVDRYEGVWVLLAYAAVAACAFVLADRESRVQALCAGVLTSASVASVVGALQAAGLDVFRTDAGRSLILPAHLVARAADVMFTRAPGDVYATVYHYNYVGSLAALLLPFALGMAAGPGVRWLRRWSAAASVPMAVCWLTCGSRAGLIGGAAGMLVLLAVYRRQVAAHWRVGVAAVATVCALVVAADAALGGRIHRRAGALVSDLAVLGGTQTAAVAVPPITRVRIAGHVLRLEYRGRDLVVVERNGDLAFTDGDGRELWVQVTPQGDRVAIAEDGYRDLLVRVGRLRTQPALALSDGECALHFVITGAGFRPAMRSGRLVPETPIEAWGFGGRESLGSARAYIWSRALPLVRERPWLGSGPDTFAAVFPQQDFDGKFRVYGTSDMLVDKAHNFYLQMAVNSGLLSLAALVLLFGWYIQAGARDRAGAAPATPVSAVSVACLAGVVGYLVAAVFNDSAVSVAPLWWIVLGMGSRLVADSISARPGGTRSVYPVVSSPSA